MCCVQLMILQSMMVTMQPCMHLSLHQLHHSLQVKYAALSNYEEREEDFKAEAVMLRRRFTSDGATTHDAQTHCVPTLYVQPPTLYVQPPTLLETPTCHHRSRRRLGARWG